MKIKSLSIKNYNSFKEKREINFDPNFNVFIGPNGGGKSNLFDLLNIVLTNFLMPPQKINKANDVWSFEQVPSRSLHNIINKFYGDDSNQEIGITLIVEQQDIDNITTVISQKDKFDQVLSNYKDSPIHSISHLCNEWIVEYPITFEKKYFENIILKVLDNGERNEIKNFYKLQDSLYTIDGNLNSSQTEKIKSILLRNLNIGLRVGQTIRFNFINNSNVESFEAFTSNKTFFQYLQNYELIRILSEDIDSMDLKPISLFFSPYRNAEQRNLRINLSNSDFALLYLQKVYTSFKFTSNLTQLATHKLAEIKRDLEYYADDEGYLEKFLSLPLIKKLKDLTLKFGYDWHLECRNRLKNDYEIILEKNHQQFSIFDASSGEKELINFLFGLVVVNVKNGLIVIDEPELHLHPNWQSKLLDILLDHTKEMNNQLFLLTHSGQFVTKDILNNVQRVYLDSNFSTDVVSIDESQISEIKNTLHIVNIQNNTKLFFSDIVVLVEGIQDRILFKKIINALCNLINFNKVIEILDISGKENYPSYSEFLNAFKIEYHFITDNDYLESNGDESIKKLFVTDFKAINDKTIKDKKSRDRKKLSEEIDIAIATNNLEALKNTWNYIKGRHKILKEPLTGEEESLITNFISKKRTENIHILKNGEIEDYLPNGKKDINGTIELLKDQNFIPWLKSYQTDKNVGELLEICSKILSIQDIDNVLEKI